MLTSALNKYILFFFQVARDKVLKEWKFPENIEFSREHGSGYPSGKVKSADEPSGPSVRGRNSGFCSMKRLGILLSPPGWDASPSQGYPQHYIAGTHLFTWVKIDNVE